jgi:hypothetical protein
MIHAPVPLRRTISECIALLPEDSTAVMDADFAKDVEVAIESHREPTRRGPSAYSKTFSLIVGRVRFNLKNRKPN